MKILYGDSSVIGKRLCHCCFLIFNHIQLNHLSLLSLSTVCHCPGSSEVSVPAFWLPLVPAGQVMKNNTAVVPIILLSLTLWKNSPEIFFFSSILLGILQCCLTKTWQKFTCWFYWNHSLWYWKMLSCFSVLSFGCDQILSAVYEFLKWRVIFLFGIYVVDSPLILSK